MRRIKRIRLIVKEEHGCPVHEAGDEAVFHCVGDHSVKMDGTICLGALTSLMPKIYAFHNNARFHWTEEDDAVTHACPDGETPVTFEILREYE